MAIRRTTIVSGSLFAASLWLIAGALPRAAAAEIPEPVRQALESNARSLSPITVARERTRSSDLPLLRVISLLGQKNDSSFLPDKSLLMWDNGQFYNRLMYQTKKLSQPIDSPPNKAEAVTTFDGQKSYCLTKWEGNTGGPPQAIIDTVKNYMTKEGPNVRFYEADYFYEAGFRFPEWAKDYVAKSKVRPLPLYLVQQGASVIEVGREEVDGASCTALVLRSGTGETRFLLDPAKGYAVRRRVEKTPSGEVAKRVDCTDFAQLPGSGVWMPRKVVVESHNWPDAVSKPMKEVVIRDTYWVSELKSEPIPPEKFTLKDFDPGTFVSDGTIEGTKKDGMGRVAYLVPADPKRLDEVIQSAASGKDYKPTIVSFRRNFILGNVLLIVIAICVAWWHVRRKSR